jgi:hypothetical protein
VSRHSDADDRPKVVAGIACQTATLRLAGKSLYAPAAALLTRGGLRLEEQYRVFMGLCPFFCIFGWIALTLCRRRTSPPLSQPTAAKHAGDADGHHATTASARSADGDERWPVSFLATSACIAATAGARQSGTVLWPLYVRDEFGWGAAQFAWALLAENLATIGALMVLPSVAQRAGAAGLAVGALGACAALAGIAFGGASTHAPSHVACMVAYLTGLAALDSLLRTLGTMGVPPVLQGRAFAYLGVLTSLGTAVGSLTTHLYAAHAASALAPAVAALAASALLLSLFRAALAAEEATRAASKQRLSPPVSPALALDATHVEDHGLGAAEREALLHSGEVLRPPFGD